MRRRHTRVAATVSALAAGALAAFTLRPHAQSAAAISARTPAVEVRTVVIRRTIRVVRHAPSVGGRAPGAAHGSGPAGSATPGTVSTAAPAAVTTRSSPSQGASSGVAPSAAITTRTSPSSGGTSRPLTTRASGSGSGDGGGGDGGDGGGDGGGDD